MLILLLLLIILIFVLKTPSVQNNLAQRATRYLSKKYHTSIVIDKIDLSGLTAIKLNGVVIKDHHDYPFIKVKKLRTSILNYKNFFDNSLELSDVSLNEFDFVLKTYKGEEHGNINIFVDKFNSKSSKKSKTPFLLTSSELTIQNSNFYLYNENTKEEPIVFYKNINGVVKDFRVFGPNIYGKISKTSFVDDHNIKVINFASDFTYTSKQMLFKETTLKTKNSDIALNMIFNFEKKDLSDFNNKVQIDANITKANISLIDLNQFYNELGKSDKLHFSTKFTGTLNNFKLNKLQLVSDRNSIVRGNFHLKNAFEIENGFSLKSNISNLTSDYEHLTALLPNILGKTLPTNFKMFGRFKLKGQSFITKEDVDAQLEIVSDLGTSISDLKITNIGNDINKASYKGKIELIDFELGRVVKDSLIGQFSMIADVDGSGFTKETLNTSVIGHISKHQYKGYTYSNIDVNGVFKNQHFNGDLVTNDKNIKMTFKGLADLSSQVYAFKFKADVAYANFNKLNLFKQHSKSVLKGKIDIDVKGNTIDNIVGAIKFKNASYTNHLDKYEFKNFDVTSSFKDEVRTLKVNSKDIINGRVRGKFKFKELPTLTKNSLASIYTHYRPDSVSTGQFLDFNFKIYDKIIGVFYPDIKLGKNTSIKGKINSDKEKFELTFKSPKVEMKDNLLEKIRLQIDNKNPLYNTILSVNKLNTKYYNIEDLNLVNVTLNDTLFVQTDFIGGKDLKEKFNLSLYHTINTENKSVIGFKKSDILFRNQKWFLNKFNDKESKVVFDNNFRDFDFKKLKLISGNQKMDFRGLITNREDKDLHVNFSDISLDKIVPKIDSISLNGIVNGHFNFNQKGGKTVPKIDLNIANLEVNNYNQGNLLIKAQADKTFKKYDFEASLLNDKIKTLAVKGTVDTKPKDPIINAVLNLSKLDLRPYSPLGGDAISNIRGEISGQAKLTGLVKNPNMKGDLFLENAGMSFPYLAVDYRIDGKQRITLRNQQFDFNTTKLVDTDKQTEAYLTGTITHTEFKKWFLDLAVDSENMLVLNTKEDEESMYYGTALIDIIDGEATIKGYTDALVIEVVAKTNTGTEFIVPLSDVNTIEENKLVHFINKVKDDIDLGRPDEIIFDKKGLTLLINLEVTPDALAEIVIDKATGSVLKGKGFAYLDIEINTTGKFEMFGTYIVDQGEYQLKNIVNKTFKVKQNGKITWNGSPFDAFLDIEAVNKVKANPSILLENIQGTRDIDVDLITKITGNLYEPQMKFDIALPKASSIVQSELAFKINDEDKKMTQFLSLLSSGTFINFDNVDFANSGNSFLVGTLSERISSAISNLLRGKDDRFQVGVNLELGDENKLNNLRTDDQVGVTVQTKLFKKIILNGVVGVPLNSNSQSGVTGELEAELPLNKAENFRAKAYNRRNEVEFDVLDSEGYTQGVGLSYQFNWDTGSEFLEKTGLKRSKAYKEKLKLKKLAKKRKRDSLIKLRDEKLINFSTIKKDTIK